MKKLVLETLTSSDRVELESNLFLFFPSRGFSRTILFLSAVRSTYFSSASKS